MSSRAPTTSRPPHLAAGAHDGAGEREECLVNLMIAFVAGPEAAEVVQVGEASLDDPALRAQLRAVLGAAASDDWLDAASPEQAGGTCRGRSRGRPGRGRAFGAGARPSRRSAGRAGHRAAATAA